VPENAPLVRRFLRCFGPPPEQCWEQRLHLGEEEGGAFASAVQSERRQARLEQGHRAQDPLEDAAQAVVDRVALARAMVLQGWLTLMRESRAAPEPQRAGRKPKSESR
jgi:hypothetical protein